MTDAEFEAIKDRLDRDAVIAEALLPAPFDQSIQDRYALIAEVERLRAIEEEQRKLLAGWSEKERKGVIRAAKEVSLIPPEDQPFPPSGKTW